MTPVRLDNFPPAAQASRLCSYPGLLLLAAAMAICPRIQAADVVPSSPVDWHTIPIDSQSGRVMVQARLNDLKPRFFLLDSGYGINMVHPSLVGELGLKRAGTVTIVGIAGEEDAGMYSGASFDFGTTRYEPRRVASLPSEAKSRRRRDGILGAGFFKRYVVELDLQHNSLRSHEPKGFKYDGKGVVLPMTFPKDTPVIEASILDADGKAMPGRFEIDTGCDGGLCLGSHFLEASHLLESANRESIRSGVGGGARVKSGTVPNLRMGAIEVAHPSTSFFLQGSPVDETQAGHIGIQAFRKLKVIFDYSRNQLILEPSAPGP